MVLAYNDLAKEAEATGCRVKYSDYVVPSIESHVLQDDKGRLARLEVPDPRRDGRLPGFLFERSQQVDRLSRRDLFVVSLAPSREEPDWPPLFDFRQQTVERLEKVARHDLGRRIGMVQSWGRPHFQLSVPVQGVREEAPGAAVPASPTS